MTRCLIKTIDCFNGELYVIKNGQRYKVADCSPEIRLYEHSFSPPILKKGHGIKSKKVSIVFCENESNQELNEFSSLEDFIGVTGYDLVTEAVRDNGKDMVRFELNDLKPTSIEVLGEWEFELDETRTKELLLKLKG